MNITSIASTTHPLNLLTQSNRPAFAPLEPRAPFEPQTSVGRETSLGADTSAGKKDDDEVREKFQEWAGQTFYGTLLKEMRKTIDKPAYMHGGRAEEVFQTQLDQLLVEEMSEATADSFSDPMYELFALNGTRGR